MIEIRNSRNVWILLGTIAFMWSIPTLLILYSLLTYSSLGNLTLSDILALGIPLTILVIFLVVSIAFIRNTVYRVETGEGFYCCTTLAQQKIIILPAQVRLIRHSGTRYVWVLDHHRRLSFYKTSCFHFMSLVNDGFDPWKNLMTQSRFPEADYKPLTLE